MPTNKVVLRKKEEFMADYTPVYQPIYPLLLGKSQEYSETVGEIDFKRLEAVGDLRGKHITPKDTEIKQIAVGDTSKTFKKYFLAKQYIESKLQDRESIEDIIRQVLDEHQKQMDELMAFGEGTSDSTMINNGYFWSDDVNYVLETSVEVNNNTGTDYLIDLFAKVQTTVNDADNLAGRKLIIFYGTDILPMFNGLFAASNTSFKAALSNVLGSNYSFASMPKDITPASSNGWIIVNLDQIKVHYTKLPELDDQGTNDEKMYAWFNFLMGSAMIEVLASGGIIRQPATKEA
jgi:hypothetical protein